MDVSALIRKTALKENLSDEERQALLQFADEYGSQVENWRSAVDSAVVERDRACSELTALKRRDRVAVIAREHGFADVQYLDFLLREREIDLDDSCACSTAITAIKEHSPGLFRLDLAPGAGSAPSRSGGWPGAGGMAGTPGDLAAMLQNAPEINA